MSLRPRQLARLGTYLLEEAVLDVLYEAFKEPGGIGAADISRRAGIYRERGPSDIMNDAIVHGILNCLHERNKVQRVAQPSGRGGWRLTDAEYEARSEQS